LRRARLAFIDEAGAQIGVDRHLLAGHRIQAEACGDFRDAARTFGDDDEVHDDQDREDDGTDNEVAAHHEIAEGLNHMARGGCSGPAMAEDQPCRGEIERQAQHRRDEQHRREGREFQWPLDKQADHQDKNGQGDRQRQADIEQPGRHGQDHDRQDRDDTKRQRDLAALQRDDDLADDVGRALSGGGNISHRRSPTSEEN
jgi:hypothetical protein